MFTNNVFIRSNKLDLKPDSTIKKILEEVASNEINSKLINFYMLIHIKKP